MTCLIRRGAEESDVIMVDGRGHQVIAERWTGEASGTDVRLLNCAVAKL